MSTPTQAPNSAPTHDDAASRWERLKDIVADALERPAPERNAFLDEACAGDADLRREAGDLAGINEPATTCVLHPRVDAFVGLSGPDPAGMSGIRVGRYELLELLGEGGMAAVYLARQDNVDRRVAVKVFRPHAMGYDAATRFEREVKALGRIDHPGVARILEAGIHRDRQQPGSRPVPYIAMEYVDGLPLTRYADVHALDLPARIDLMIGVADAVHAAHQRAVVHRDLKPANVLATHAGGRHVPKVLDFGIARVLRDADVSDVADRNGDRARTLETTAGVLLGTLGYMAPEQARGEADQIDVRSDVFALGVLLHELVTGKVPTPVGDLPLTEALRRLGEADGVTASVAHAIPGDTSGGDLGTILATALANEKERRYPSAEAFADDLRRLRANRPIEARPPTKAYVMRKFVRRNQAAVAAAVAVSMALLVGSAAATVGFVRESYARQQADRDRQAAELAMLTAEAEALRAKAARGFVSRIIEAADVEAVDGDEEITLLAAIRAAEPELVEFTAGDKQVESDVRLTLARALRSLGAYDDTVAQYEAAIRTSDEARAELADQAGLPAASQLSPLWPIELRFEYVSWLANQGYVEAARSTYDAAKAMLDATDANDGDKSRPRVELEQKTSFASLLDAEGESSRAADAFLEAIAVAEKMLEAGDVEGTDRAELSTMRNNAAVALLYAGRPAEAEPLLRVVRDHRREAYGPTNPATLRASANLASALVERGQPAAAVDELRPTLDLAVKNFGVDHPVTRSTRNGLFTALRAVATDEAIYEAVKLSQESVASLERTGELESSDAIFAINNLTVGLMEQERFVDAVASYDKLIPLTQSHFGEHHPAVYGLRSARANARFKSGDQEAGLADLRAVLAEQTERFGDTQQTVTTRANLAHARLDLAEAAEAAAEFAACVQLSEANGWAGMTPTFRRNLGKALVAAGDYPAAEAALLKAYEETQALGPAPAAKTADELVKLYTAWDKPADVATWRERSTAE